MKKQILLPVAAILAAAVLLLAMSFGLNGLAAGNAQKAHQELMQTLLPGSTQFQVEPYAGDDELIQSVHNSGSGW